MTTAEQALKEIAKAAQLMATDIHKIFRLLQEKELDEEEKKSVQKV